MRILPIRIENFTEAKNLLTSLNVSSQSLEILAKKSLYCAFKIEGINSWEANIIKQYLLSLGADSAVNKEVLVRQIKTDTIIFGNIRELQNLVKKLSNQPGKLKEISQKISLYLDNFFKENFKFVANNKKIKIKEPMICAIVNMTPDSFSGDGLLKTENLKLIKDLVINKVDLSIKGGAKIIDIGGQSSRPFSKPISEKEEMRRILPAIKIIRKKFSKILLSVDTYRYNVAKAAVEEGVDIINDITALRYNPRIASLIKKYKLGCVIMHMKGMPQTMQINPKYKDVMGQIIDFFSERLMFLKKEGIDQRQILIDPGIGFGKTVEDNLVIIKNLYKLKIFGLPIFLGISRKSFIGKLLNLDVKERLLPTIAVSVFAILNGANILRAHDVKETQQMIKILSEIRNYN
ncbi:MAG: dihydropteroate synthase [Candidatus Omnitrophica bacterium]|nr:dihydropteroate synthase [Candidatus Omnitrophota bacterium]